MRQAIGTACPVPGRWVLDELAVELTLEHRPAEAAS